MEGQVLQISLRSVNCILIKKNKCHRLFPFFQNQISSFSEESFWCMSDAEVKQFALNKKSCVTYAEEFGEELQDFSSGIVSVSPVVRWHPNWTVFRKSVVQEVPQQLG